MLIAASQVLCIGLTLAFLAGCQSNQALSKKQGAGLNSPNAIFAKFDLDAAELRESLDGKTVLSYGAGPGSYVTYYGAEGGVYLWYPFNKKVVRGEWRTESSKPVNVSLDTKRGRKRRSIKNAKICFLYSKQNYDPVTGKLGGKWECRSSVFWIKQMVEKTDGDVFKLISGKVPFRLNKRKTTITELKSACKTC